MTEYAVMNNDREPLREGLEQLGKNVDYEHFEGTVYVAKTDASLLELRDVYAGMNKCAADSGCMVKRFKKERWNMMKIRSFLTEGDNDKFRVVIFE